MSALLLVDAARRVSERRRAVDGALKHLEQATRAIHCQTFRDVIAAREALSALGADLCDLERALRLAESNAPPARLRILTAERGSAAEFVEIETVAGKGVALGTWIDLGDGFHALEFTAADVERAAAEVG